MKKVAIITGYTCNNNCRFCYDAEKRHIYPDLTTVRIIGMLELARRRGCEYVDFIGGEFTIREDAVKIVATAKRLGFRTIATTTNGRIFSYKKVLQNFKNAGLNSIIFSVHGNNARLHDYQTRVKGSFRQLMKAIKNAKELGYPIYTNTTITRLNYKKLPEIAAFLHKIGCVNAEFIFVDPTTGAAHQNFNSLVPTIKQCAPYIKKALEIGKNFRKQHWHVRYFPLCYIDSFKEQLSEACESFSREEHLAPEFANFDVQSSRKAIGRVKARACRRCKHFSICEGVWKEYAIRRGTSELIPPPL
ncbi:MAG: radical SAM protein [Candidatus Woesearchaeota archaeon]